MGCLKNHSELDVIEGLQLKSYMAENFVMNYSNIELHRVVMHQNQQRVQGHSNNAEQFEPGSP